MNLSASVYRYEPKEKNDAEVIEHMMFVAESEPQWGFSLIRGRMENEGCQANKKRLHRTYKECELPQRKRTKRRVPERVKDPIVLPIGPNITWSMDFMHDALVTGRKYRTFNVLAAFAGAWWGRKLLPSLTYRGVQLAVAVLLLAIAAGLLAGVI